MRQRAVFAYRNHGQELDLVVDASDPIEAARRTQLLDQANERDNDAVRKLAAINEDLRDQQGTLRSQETQEQAVKDQLETKAADLQSKMNEAQQAASALQAQLDREIAAAAALVDAARKRELEAERAQIGGRTDGEHRRCRPDRSARRSAGSRARCRGSAYTDDYGGGRGHQGIDMFIPIGASAIATKSGSVSYVPNEGAGGNTAYLYGSDGNVYFYAHLSQFVGGARSGLPG